MRPDLTNALSLNCSPAQPIIAVRLDDFEASAMTPKYVAPSISAHSFSCPHCGTFAHQTWSRLFAAALHDKDDLPLVKVLPQQMVAVQSDREFNETVKAEIMRTFNRLSAGELFLGHENESHFSYNVHNLHLSQCFSCNKYALWLHGQLSS
jgi:hypothetical protein